MPLPLRSMAIGSWLLDIMESTSEQWHEACVFVAWVYHPPTWRPWERRSQSGKNTAHSGQLPAADSPRIAGSLIRDSASASAPALAERGLVSRASRS